MNDEKSTEDIITTKEVQTLPGLFNERVDRSAESPAYLFYDSLNGVWSDINWRYMSREVIRWQLALAQEKLQQGDRVAIMARNSRYWVMFDQAALALGLVVVPLYTEDRADNVYYILEDAQAKFLLISGKKQWECLSEKVSEMKHVNHIVSIAEIENVPDKKFKNLSDWLPRETGDLTLPEIKPDDLATIVYTSGTTGRPKGVMLSHKNILSNTYSCLQAIPISTNEVFLSFLPLSHTLERTVGYYLPMMAGSVVAHARSIPELAKDILRIQPTGLISVPRIYERIYARLKENLETRGLLQQFLFRLAVDVGWKRFEFEQGRRLPGPSLLLWPLLKKMVADKIMQRLGGKLKAAVSGGAALSPEVARVFVGLGIPIFQGYGLTEASPVISVNREDSNIPASIGEAVPGVEVKIGENDELLARGENIMLGFWNNPEETARVIDADGWLHTGDKARIDNKHIYITGRIKDIIVLANGEKVSPVDMELAIASDALFDQVIIIGEARPFLSAITVLNKIHWQKFMKENGLAKLKMNDREVEKALINRMAKCIHEFPGYAQIRRLTCTLDPWSIENGLMTPTLKVKRPQIHARFDEDIEHMYKGHTVNVDY